jgi:hypothetical protein
LLNHISKICPNNQSVKFEHYHKGKFKNDLIFWTSGANECEPRQANIWCYPNTQLGRSNVTWMDVTKQPLATERSITLQTNANGNFGLEYSQFMSAANSILCEVKNAFFLFSSILIFLLQLNLLQPNCESASCPAACSIDVCIRLNWSKAIS